MSKRCKCRVCNSEIDVDKAFIYIHFTRSYKKQKKYYCNREEFHKWHMDKVYYDRFRRRIDKILSKVDDIPDYICVNNQKNKMLMDLYEAGYERKTVYDCLLYYEDSIINNLKRKDIEKEYQKLRYIFTVVENNIKDFSNGYIHKLKTIKSNEENECSPIEQDIEMVHINKTRRRKSLKDRLVM